MITIDEILKMSAMDQLTLLIGALERMKHLEAQRDALLKVCERSLKFTKQAYHTDPCYSPALDVEAMALGNLLCEILSYSGVEVEGKN